MAPSGRTSTLQSFNGWLGQRRAWQFALIMACAAAAASAVTMIIAQQLLHGHLNPSVVTGTTAGTMTGCFTVAFGYRLTRPPNH